MGLSPLDTRGYNTGRSITQNLSICRLSGYWTIESLMLATGCFDAQSAPMHL